MDISFEPLIKDRLPEAFKLLKVVFPYNAEIAKTAYEASLDPTHSHWETRRLLNYYTVINRTSNKIVGLTGFYNLKKHPEDEIWLGWFCVDPIFRGKGIGRKILMWTINKAREMNYQKLKLWTSTDPDEAVAQSLYDSVGLKIYKTEKSKEFPDEEILYRELEL